MMLSRPIILAAALLLFPALGLADGEARFMTYPDISGDRIVFTFDDDLWVASAQGGTPAGDDLVFAGNSKVYVTSFEKAYQSRKLGKPADTTGMVYRVSPVEEWTQILNDTWRWYRDFFYDKGMHGRDWKAIGDQYRACVKDLRSRDQLNWLLSEMVGELCVSHTYISGGDTGRTSASSSRCSPGCSGPIWRPTRRPGCTAWSGSTGRRRTSAASRCRSRAPTSAPGKGTT